MENRKPFATPAHYSHRIVNPTPSSSSLSVQAMNSKSMSASEGKFKSNSSLKNEISLAPPAFSMQKVAGNRDNGEESASEQDPFVSARGKQNGNIKKLSPTATPFKPCQPLGKAKLVENQLVQSTPKHRVFETPGASSLASGRTFKENDTPRTIRVTEGIFDYVFPTGSFGSGRHTRYLSILGVPGYLTADAFIVLIKGKTYSAPLKIVEARRVPRTVYLSFSSIVDSVNAAGEIPNQHTKWSVDFINAAVFSEALVHGSGSYTSIHKGQLIVVATHHGPPHTFFEHAIADNVMGVMKTYGAILAWKVITVAHPSVHIHMEYYDLGDSETAKAALDEAVIGSLELAVKDYEPDVLTRPATIVHEPVVVVANIEDDLSTMVDTLTVEKSSLTVPGMVEPQFGYLETPRTGLSSNSGRATISRGNTATPSRVHFTGPTPYTPGFPAANGYNGTPHTAAGSFASGYTMTPGMYSGSLGHQDMSQALAPMSAYRVPFRPGRPQRMNYLGNNVVVASRVTQGLDVRTTIMLRNIPNKMPQAELKQYIDETSHGDYDFMYLRIDFANNCNVGYAFVNFVDPLSIVKFVNARAGTKWSRYHSDKVAEISYATIQGKDCLIQKFRNSSVMLEDPAFRPKLYHAGTGPMAGREETFPGPDNDSKLRRSIENAGAVGLFAPRAGQVFRDSQRRRRSQFDRGTNLAQIEESYASENDYHSQVTFGGSRSAPAWNVKF